MGLSINDKKPVNISLKDAYSKIRRWYRVNIKTLRSLNNVYEERSSALIKVLPPTKIITVLEIRAVLGEVIGGNLEWGYHKEDGKYKMAAYAHGALEASGLNWHLSENERNQLKKSVLWPYLIIGDS
jgi:hypothetical protein